MGAAPSRPVSQGAVRSTCPLVVASCARPSGETVALNTTIRLALRLFCAALPEPALSHNRFLHSFVFVFSCPPTAAPATPVPAARSNGDRTSPLPPSLQLDATVSRCLCPAPLSTLTPKPPHRSPARTPDSPRPRTATRLAQRLRGPTPSPSPWRPTTACRHFPRCRTRRPAPVTIPPRTRCRRAPFSMPCTRPTPSASPIISRPARAWLSTLG